MMTLKEMHSGRRFNAKDETTGKKQRQEARRSKAWPTCAALFARLFLICFRREDAGSLPCCSSSGCLQLTIELPVRLKTVACCLGPRNMRLAL